LVFYYFLGSVTAAAAVFAVAVVFVVTAYF
jgi:hypothetical protein